jgi:MYXO-CTERM domain-containing protein
VLESDDDDCAGVSALCGPSGGYWNAIIDGRPLDAGTYTVAVGDYHFSEVETRGGNNDAARFGDVGITITSRDGIAVLAGQVAVVPGPGAVSLLGTGLAGLGAVGVVRRRRTRAE